MKKEPKGRMARRKCIKGAAFGSVSKSGGTGAQRG